MSHQVLAWLKRAVMYEIYPQSFADSDGIGDLRGIIDRLKYLQWLGADALWLNPCFASPMRDAGYDVSDYLLIAPRSKMIRAGWKPRGCGGRSEAGSTMFTLTRH
ncbi:MAG TPA: alpha-amylase family glycosyl hydrolase [Streptosporangiaceae bacterium]|nr:alpha-amylase family glycosyl hydrolase [Streptosporangiaceae bacterium]